MHSIHIDVDIAIDMDTDQSELWLLTAWSLQLFHLRRPAENL